MRDANRPPLYFCLAGGLVGCVASAVAWWMLGALWWMPSWRQLRNHGMNADDNGWAMGVAFVPPIIGIAFLISTLMGLITVRWTGRPKLVLILLNLLPGLSLTLLEINAVLRGQYWEYPGFEVACMLIGLGWGAALYALTLERSGWIEG